MPNGESSPEVELVASCYAAWSERRLDHLLNAVSDDCVYTMHVPEALLAFAGRHEGREAIRACLESILVEFADVLMVVDDWTHGAGEIVRTRVVYYYTHPETGDQLDGVLRHVWRVKDGRVVQLDEYHDAPRLEAFLKMVRGSQ
jgi:ketosteroid isomerase-like protein